MPARARQRSTLQRDDLVDLVRRASSTTGRPPALHRMRRDAPGVRTAPGLARMIAVMDSVRLSEDDWLGTVTDLATLRGWHWLHLRPAMKRHGGWITAVAGDLGEGWPDLFLVRGIQSLYAELKSDNGQLTADQRRVHELLRSSGATVHVWRPPDWPFVLEALT